jgi:hypothetical protein
MQYMIEDLPTRAAFIPARNGDEQDVISKAARRALASLVNHPGATRKTKARMHRRERRDIRRILSA